MRRFVPSWGMISGTIVITGASEGIGRQLAVALARPGTNLVLAARKREPLELVVQQCEQAGAQAVAVPTDVADPAACKALIDHAVQRFGGIDVLVNNAGVAMYAKFET